MFHTPRLKGNRALLLHGVLVLAIYPLRKIEVIYRTYFGLLDLNERNRENLSERSLQRGSVVANVVLKKLRETEDDRGAAVEASQRHWVRKFSQCGCDLQR